MYFSDCEKVYDSYHSLLNITGIIFENEHLKELWINSIINQATIYYQRNRIDKACDKWKKIMLIDDIAYKNYRNTCIMN